MLLLLPLGILVLAVIFADFVQTTLGAQQAGRVSRVVTGLLWRGARGLRFAAGPAVHRYVGPAILALMALTWIVVHWAGWTLVHLAVDGAVRTDTGEAGLVETLAYVGASLSTLGASLARPGGPWWDVASAMAAINGMVVLTLSVTFVLNVTQAVVKGREFAVLVHAHHHEEFFEKLQPKFSEVASQLNAFPVALYFSLPQPERRTVPAIRDFLARTLTCEERLEEMRPTIATLPGMCAEGDLREVRAEVARWSARHMLDRPGSLD